MKNFPPRFPTSSSSESSLLQGLILALMYRHPYEQSETLCTPTGAFQINDVDVFGIVSFFVPFVILKQKQSYFAACSKYREMLFINNELILVYP